MGVLQLRCSRVRLLQSSLAIFFLAIACRTTLQTTAPSSPAVLPIEPPTLRQQIVDHVNAYVTEVICYEPSRERYSQWPAIASRNTDLSTYNRSGEHAAPCTTFNRVAEIPYRAPDVEEAVYDVMNEQMNQPLYLRSTLMVLWAFAVRGVDKEEPGRPIEVTALETEARLHDFFWRVPTLGGALLASVGSRLNCSECALGKTDSPAPSLDQIRKALATMSRGYEDASGSTFYGIQALQPDHGDLDPNVVVAISRAARGSLVSTPSLEAVVKVLETMGLAPQGN